MSYTFSYRHLALCMGLLAASLHTLVADYDPLLAVVLMVKNEEEAIQETLQPYVDAGIRSFLIFDTGSTDHTIAKAQELFTQHAITTATIMQEPFVDFATSRNRALELAEQQFPHAEFWLMPDAEWYMHHVDALLAFCKEEAHTNEPAYLVRIGNRNFEFYTQRLLRRSAHLKFAGVIHETIDHYTNKKVPFESYFELRPSPAGNKRSEKRWKNDLEKQLKRYRENPFDPRTVFYLAQTYECLGDLEKAYTYYWERTQLHGWSEEDYMALYRLAGVLNNIAASQITSRGWMEPLHYYLQAYAKRPQRAEPLVKVAQHYMDLDQMQLAFCFARQACEVPYPEDDILFVEKELYDYVRYEILGRCAWYVGQFEIGEEATRKALLARPDFPHLHNNLAFYTNRRASK